MHRVVRVCALKYLLVLEEFLVPPEKDTRFDRWVFDIVPAHMKAPHQEI